MEEKLFSDGGGVEIQKQVTSESFCPRGFTGSCILSLIDL